MRMRRALYLLLALVLALSLVSCNDEERVEATYDEQGNLIREDYYYGREWDRYVIYTYDEAGRVKTKTTYTIEDVKMEMVEYAYHENNKVACENSWLYDENGNQSHHQILEYDVAGKKTYERYFDEQDRPLSSSQYSESEIAVLFEHWEYDENGNFTGRHILEQTEEALVIRQEDYDATDTLTRKSTYRYHANGVQAEHKTVNGDGLVIQHGILDENGKVLYDEYGSFHDNGKPSQSLQTRYEGDVRITTIIAYDQDGALVETEVTHSNEAVEIKTEKTNAAGEVIYYKDMTRLDEMLFDRNGNYAGRHVAEYYPDGIQVRYEKEVNARGQLVYERTLSENGIPLKNENNTYNEAGYQLSHSYEEYLNEEILLKSESWTRDDQGREIEKRIVNYDHFGNVIFDEEYKNGKLVRRYTAEYYGPERPRRTESYRNDGIEEETRIEEYDEKNRLTYRYQSGGGVYGGESTEIYRYNSADVVVYQERIIASAHDYRTVEEFYDNGQQKSLSVYNQNGELTLQTTWDVAGNVTSSYHQGAGGGAATGPIPETDTSRFLKT